MDCTEDINLRPDTVSSTLDHTPVSSRLASRLLSLDLDTYVTDEKDEKKESVTDVDCNDVLYYRCLFVNGRVFDWTTPIDVSGDNDYSYQPDRRLPPIVYHLIRNDPILNSLFKTDDDVDDSIQMIINSVDPHPSPPHLPPPLLPTDTPPPPPPPVCCDETSDRVHRHSFYRIARNTRSRTRSGACFR